jgi:cell division ATPase FtsA
MAMLDRVQGAARPRRVAAIALEEDRLSLAVGRARGPVLEKLDFIEEKPSAGLARGMVADAELFSDALDHLVTSLERVSRSHDLSRIVCGVHGPFIDIRYLERDFELSPGEPLDAEELRRLLHETAERGDEDGVLLHVMPWRFLLDGYRETPRPAGLRGERLRVDVLGVYGDESPVSDFEDVFDELGLTGADLALTSLATAKAALGETERERGVVLVELAWEDCRISVYRRDRLYLHRATAAGLQTLAESICRLVRMTPIEARRLIPTLSLLDTDDPLSKMSRRFLESVLAEAKRFLAESLSVMGEPPEAVGWVLTGLLADAEGADRVARKYVGAQVRVARPKEAFRIPGHDDSAACALVGLLECAASERSVRRSGAGRRAVEQVRDLPRRLWRRLTAGGAHG